MLLTLTLALASPLNPWGSATPAGAAVVNPYLYVYPDAVNPILYGSAGLSDRVDVFLGVGQYLPNAAPGSGTLEAFPRFFLVPQLALSPHLYWTPGTGVVTVAPEAHANFSAGRFALTANAGWRPVLGGDAGFDAGTVPILVAPELKLGDRFSLYVEVDPTVSLGGGDLALLVVPGFGVTLDAEGRHTASAGLQVPVLPEVAATSLGVWYAYLLPAAD